MTKENVLSAYILLDRSGSMGGPRWENAIASINAYADGLVKEKVNAEISVFAFDSETYKETGDRKDKVSLHTLRHKESAKKFKKIDQYELSPRGGTPLYDATARVLNIADERNNERTAIIIITDGEENESLLYNLTSIRDRISTCRHRKWEVLFLGAEFNVERVAQSWGLGINKAVNLNNSADLTRSMASYAISSAMYATTGAAVDTTKLKEELGQTK